jgi:DNA-binding transcriptional LysR family regulator
VRLFERTRRSVKLTPAGEFLKSEFARIVSDLENVTNRAREVAAGEIGVVRIGHPASITFSVLPTILARLGELHPHIAVQMFEVDSGDVDASLHNQRIDVSCNRETTKSPDLVSVRLMTENFAIVTSRERNTKSLAELREEWFVLPSLAGHSEHAAQLRAIFADAGFEPKVRFESDFGATLLGLVAKGLGVSVMPLSYSHYQTDEVKFVPIPFTSDLYATTRRDDDCTVLKNLMDVVGELFEE